VPIHSSSHFSHITRTDTSHPSQVNSSVGAQMTMPNSARPFVLNWAPPGFGGASTSSGSQSQSQSQSQAASSANGNGNAIPAPNNGNANANSDAGGRGGFGQQLQGQSGMGMGSCQGAAGGGGMGLRVGVGGAAAYPKEYSIFVGDLAPETSNSDLVAVSIAGFFAFLGRKAGRGRRLATVPRSSPPSPPYHPSLSPAPPSLPSPSF
jgi:hypothetical protein